MIIFHIIHYKEGHELILKLAEFFIKEDSLCYSGTSTGTLHQVSKKIHEQKFKIYWH